jgi:hypothetical protein
MTGRHTVICLCGHIYNLLVFPDIIRRHDAVRRYNVTLRIMCYASWLSESVLVLISIGCYNKLVDSEKHGINDEGLRLLFVAGDATLHWW